MAGFDIVGAATNAVDTVKNVFNSDGPAKGLSGFAADVEEGFKKFTSSLGNLFKAAGADPFLLPLPLPNVLNDYATYNYVFSLGCLNDQAVNFPDSTYKAGIEPQLILKSSNGSPDNRVATAYGKFDFFIDSLTINSLIGNDKSTGNTNATTFDFSVIEPYSMGMFMISLQQAAFDAGWKNFREAAYLLKIEFKGNTQAGIAQTVPKTTRYIPFRFTNISMKVNAKGSVYQVSGLPYNEQSFSKQVSALQTDTIITGKTVQELLQTGPQSLQAVKNKAMKRREESKDVDQADQILIYFPKDISSGGGAAASDAAKEDDSSATSSPSSGAGGDVFTKLGVTLSDKNSTMVQDTGDCNAIGKAPMGFGKDRKADIPVASGQKIYDPKSGTEIRGKMANFDPEKSEFKFSQDTDVPNAINQVILASKYPEGALDPANLSPEGYRGWWKIETQTFIIGPVGTKSGTRPKLHVYRVIPYAVHASKFMPPNAPAPGFAQLKQQVVKEYNYIYTGKNQEILNFNIDIANGFQQMILVDNGNNTADEKKAKNDSQDVGKQSDQETKSGNTPPAPGGGMPSQTSASVTRTGQDSKGGGGAETNATRVAKMFHDAITNGKDLVNLDLEIMGDPYFLATSGFGNYTAKQTTKSNINADGEVNYQNGEVDIVINFRTPIDINQSTGLYNFGGTVGVNQFSGLYKVTTLVSTFSKGKFTQKLSGFRRQGQDDFRTASASQVPSATASKPAPATDYSYSPASNPQVFDDGSSIQTMDDGSTLVTDSDGNISSTPSPE
jgi:hypothetical protein